MNTLEEENLSVTANAHLILSRTRSKTGPVAHCTHEVAVPAFSCLTACPRQFWRFTGLVLWFYVAFMHFNCVRWRNTSDFVKFSSISVEFHEFDPPLLSIKRKNDSGCGNHQNAYTKGVSHQKSLGRPNNPGRPNSKLDRTPGSS